MASLSTTELKALLASEKADALAAASASKLSEERSKALDYYNGDMSREMPTLEGRSSAVSTDVADTIEGLMPSLMEIFAGGDEVVRFEPVGPEDERAAEQETDYVNHVFMQQNPGFMVLYTFIKDALLSKVGIVKVWWDEYEEEDRQTFYDQTDDAFALLVSDPDVDVVEHSEREELQVIQAPGPDGEMSQQQVPVKLHDVTIVTKKKHECARVEAVPPEEFGISRHAKSVKDAGYCFHEVIRREADLVDDGFDAKQLREVGSYTFGSGQEEQARDTVDESSQSDGDDGLNKANRLIRITEHYIRMDYLGDGKPRLYRVTTGGEQGIVLRRNGKPDIVEYDCMPFAAMTPIIVTHRFFGKSVADLVMDIQRIKTALYRALLDNAYLANNPRTEVPQSHANEQTLDDLLVSRPGGIVRTSQPGGLTVIATPPIGNHVLPLIEYVDATREWRTGVTRQGQGIDANALQNQSATAVNQAYTAAQARMKLIARIFAETGVRDMFSLLHTTIRKYGKKQATVRLRNAWTTIDPREWKSRYDMTINVGLGTGGKQEQLSGMMALIGLQKEALANGLTNLVSVKNLYQSAKEVVRLIGKPSVEQFFTDPETQPQPQPQPDPKLMAIQAKAQTDERALGMKAEIEKLQAQADIETQRQKTQAEIAQNERKADLESRLMVMTHELEREKIALEMERDRQKHALELAKLQAGLVAGEEAHRQRMEQNEAAAASRETASEGA